MLYLLTLSLWGSCIVFIESCDWRANDNFHVVKAILENQLKQNDTILWELAGIFYNKQKPLKQVIAHYKVLIPAREEKCDQYPDCKLAYKSNDFDCPENYSCIALDYIWGKYPMTAQDIVFRDLDVCPLVIGYYEQKEIDIYFILNSPPSCDSSSVNITAIEEEELPCGWQCEVLQTKFPVNGEANQPIFRSVEKETPLERALTGITTKLLAFSTVKEAIESLDYDRGEAMGYAARLPSSTYFNPFVEYGLFVSSYVLMHIVIFMLVYRYKNRIYQAIYKYVRKDKIEFCLFWSFMITSVLLFFNVTFVFAVEGGICITLLQLYLLCISIFPGLMYIVISICHLKRKNGFFMVFQNLICVKFPFLDHLMQILVFSFLFTLPHIIVLVVYFSSVSFFFDPKSTSLLLLYFSSSSIVLWITNAIFVYLVSPFLFVCCCPPKKYEWKKLFFAICLGLSLNLMNFSIMPFIGDYFYDKRINGTSIIAIVPIAITLVGWYISGDVVKLFTIFSFNMVEAEDGKKDIELRSVKVINTTDPMSDDQPPSGISSEGNHLLQDKKRVKENEPGMPSFSKFQRVANVVKAVQYLTRFQDNDDNTLSKEARGE